MPVHMLGVSAEIDKIKKIAQNYKITVVDDNCEALGAKWKNNMLGINLICVVGVLMVEKQLLQVRVV